MLLKDVVQEAEDRVRALLAEINPELAGRRSTRSRARSASARSCSRTSSSQRDKDVDFEWDRVIALEGDSGPYLQYSHARCASILRKAGAPPVPLADVEPPGSATDAEWAVARRLLEFPQAVVAAPPKCEPHVVGHYLLELAGEFSRWYTAGNGDAALRVLCDDEPTRNARLALVAAVQAVMAEGLSLLGLAAPDQM